MCSGRAELAFVSWKAVAESAGSLNIHDDMHQLSVCELHLACTVQPDPCRDAQHDRLCLLHI